MSYPQDDEEDRLGATGEEEEQVGADSIVAGILTIARSPVFDSVHSREARRSLADHLVEEAEDWQAPLSEEERSRIASAAFDEHRLVSSDAWCSEVEWQPLPDAHLIHA